MRQIDVSKIYVDEQGIRTVGQTVLKESFARYKEMASLSSIDTLKMLNPDGLNLLYHFDEQGKIVSTTPVSIAELATAAEGLVGKVKVVTGVQFALFKELFLDVRDRFISSGEHGLDAYLSIRIRHGVLQNQIRSPFEALHLISEKDTTTGQYLENSYWSGKLPEISDDTKTIIQKELAIFSRKIDDIAQMLNKAIVQVRTERKNVDGLFDYTFDDATLIELFTNEFDVLTDVEQFLDAIFQILWKRTQVNLETIRELISGKLKDDIYECLSQLEREVRLHVEPQQAPEFLKEYCKLSDEFAIRIR